VAVVSLAEIGLPDGGTFDEITTAAQAVGLDLCPLEAAPHLRLQYTDQPKGPYLTVASQKLRSEETYPKWPLPADARRWCLAARVLRNPGRGFCP